MKDRIRNDLETGRQSGRETDCRSRAQEVRSKKAQMNINCVFAQSDIERDITKVEDQKKGLAFLLSPYLDWLPRTGSNRRPSD
jgi:hypothetical protein